MSIDQHNAIGIFVVKWNVFLEISRVLQNDIFAELDGSSGIKNIIIFGTHKNKSMNINFLKE